MGALDSIQSTSFLSQPDDQLYLCLCIWSAKGNITKLSIRMSIYQYLTFQTFHWLQLIYWKWPASCAVQSIFPVLALLNFSSIQGLKLLPAMVSFEIVMIIVKANHSWFVINIQLIDHCRPLRRRWFFLRHWVKKIDEVAIQELCTTLESHGDNVAEAIKTNNRSGSSMC